MIDNARRLIDPRRLKALYDGRQNIMEVLRKERGLDTNDALAVLLAYDLQAGSYLKRLEDPAFRAQNELSTSKLARLFDSLGGGTVLHAGTGEAKTICHVIEKMQVQVAAVYGFDISLSRLLYGAAYARHLGQDIRFFTGNMLEIPIADNAFDIVFTSHSMEPNGGQERALIEELYRVARRYVVLREPSWELGNEATQAHIEKHRYVRGIPTVLTTLGVNIVEHRLFGDDENPNNQSALTVIRKNPDTPPPAWVADGGHPYASPISRDPLQHVDDLYFAQNDGLIFPVVSGVPCLLAENGILCTKYLDASSGG